MGGAIAVLSRGRLAVLGASLAALVAYGAVAAGNALLWPAVATLAHLISGTRPRWATWGGTLAILGLFARTFHAGVDHLAFQLVRVYHDI